MRRVFTGAPAKILWWVNVLFALFVVLQFSGALQYAGIFIYSFNYDAVFMMYVLVMIFVYVPVNKNSSHTNVPWYDLLAVFLSICACSYVVIMHPDIIRRTSLQTTIPEYILGIAIILIIIEGTRRTVGWEMAILGVIFFAYPFVSEYMPGFLYGRNISLARIIQFQYVYPYGIFGNLLHIFSSVVAPFMIFGAFTVSSGVGDFFINLASSLMGGYRGGPAKISCVASGLFGSINGSPTANLMAIGVMTIPLMKKLGYKAHYAAAVEAVASTGGSLMPPVLGASAFLMMEFLGVSYMTIVAAAIIPALLYYGALFLMLDLEAVKLGLKGMKKNELLSPIKVLKEGWPGLLPIIILVVLMGPMDYSPSTACTWSILAVIASSWLMKGRGMKLTKIANSLGDGIKTLPPVCVMIAVSSLLVGIFEMTGVGVRITSGLVDLASGSLFLIVLMSALAALILGLPLNSSSVYVLTAITCAPAMIKIGIEPLAAHFVGWYYGMAAGLTPPICITSFIAATMADAPQMKTGWQGCRLGIVIFLVPLMFAFQPGLLMIGEAGPIIYAVIAAIIAVVLLSFAVEGYALVETNVVQRVLLFGGGGCLMVPNVMVNIVGLAMGTIAILWQVRDKRMKRRLEVTQSAN